MKSRLITAFFVVLLIFLGPSRVRADVPAVIRIGVAELGIGGRLFTNSSSISVVHVQHLLENEFAADGIKVEWHFYKGAGPAVTEALAEKQLDFALQGDLPSIIARAGGLKIRLLMPVIGRANIYAVVPASSTAKKLSDLKGHTVVDFKGTALQLSAARLMGSEGLALGDFKTINFDLQSMNTALATGQVDGAFSTLFSLTLRDKGLIRVIDGTKGKLPEFNFHAHLLVTDDFADRYPQIVERVVKVAVKGAQWAADPANRSALFEIWSKSGIPASVFAEDYKGDDTRVRLSPLWDPYIVGQYKRAVSDAIHLGLIHDSIDVDSWIDRKPLDRALKELGLTAYWTNFDESGTKPVS